MQMFKEFLNKYCLKELSIILFLSCLMFFIFYAKQEAYLVDVGREAYIPWQILKGELLYKDIFNVYGPLGYQINAILYAIFGVHLNTLYWAGFINSLITLASIFYISKLFVKRSIALVIACTVLFVCVYAQNFFNFIFVYSYNAVYALSGFLLSLFFALKYIKEKDDLSLNLAFLFAGFSFANKIENLPYFCFLFICLPFWLKKDWKQYFLLLGAFLLFPMISFGILLIQGVSIQDLCNAFVLIKKLVQAPSTNYFYNVYGMYFNPHFIKSLVLDVPACIKELICPIIFVIVMGFIKALLIRSEKIKILINLFVFGVIILLLIASYSSLEHCYLCLFGWIGLACLLILIVIGIKTIVLAKQKGFNSIAIQDKMYIFLLLSAILVSFKGLFSMSITCYGTFTITACIMPFTIFLINYFSKNLNAKFQDICEDIIVSLLVVTMVLCFVYNYGRILKEENYVLNTPRGVLLIRNVFPAQNQLINYIKQNTPKDSKIVTIPEGAIINFLAERDTDNRYYYLIPGNVEIFGDEQIVEDFAQNPPDYFLTTDMVYSVYNKGNICSYAPKTCDFIAKNYIREIQIDGVVGFILYRKK